MENDGIEEDVESTVGKSTSAVERYIEIALINLNKQTAKLEQLRQKKEEITQKLEAASSVAGDKDYCMWKLSSEPGTYSKKVCFRTFYGCILVRTRKATSRSNKQTENGSGDLKARVTCLRMRN